MKKNNDYVEPVEFDDFSPSQRRVAIAKDVIAGLKTKRFLATPGTYVNGIIGVKKLKIGSKIELQDVLCDSMKQCKCCAYGAIFIAAVEKFNQLPMNVVEETDLSLVAYTIEKKKTLQISYTTIEEYSHKYFSYAQISLIEVAFENFGQLYTFTDLYPDPTDRMIAIMENIIKNRGTFRCKRS